ncbi:MAG: hypothetical protein RJQ01_12030 [Microcella sp.]|uniref:hypothetical protein n=1 Tax=Microcella sp. TaxID=1913979 RepID=UPI0033158AA9
MKHSALGVAALTSGILLALAPALSASAASATIANGGFELDDIGATSITGWTTITEAIDLGTSSIAGCVTQDTSDYTNLRDYEDEADSLWDRSTENVPGESEYWFYVKNGSDYVTILGDRLVWDDDYEEWYLESEVVYHDVSTADFALSSMPAEDVEPDAPSTAPESDAGEPAPEVPEQEGAPEQPVTPEQPATPEEPSVDQPSEAPAGEQDDQAPAEPAPTLRPATASYAYTIEYDWTTDQQNAFDDARRAALPDPVERGDDPANADLVDSEYSVQIVDGADQGRSGKLVELYSELDGELDGYVIHGPAIYSAPFTAPGGRQIRLDWSAVDESDDFHVFGYLLNVDTCAQLEIIDATGESQDWTTSSLIVPADGTYRFVFVSGSYDKSWGGAAGAYLYIDNIVQTAAFTQPGIELALTAQVGDYLPGSEVQVAGGNLLPNSPYDLVLRSTPVTVTSGTTDDDGSFLGIVTLPDDITPGQHTLTLTGESAGGPLTQVVYITVGADGTLLYASTVGPQPQLAMTGPVEQTAIAAVGLLLMAGGTAALVRDNRRRRSTANLLA